MRTSFSRLVVAASMACVCSLLVRAPGADDPAPRPVSVQELSLLLRSGYTGDETLRETAGRPLLAPLDAAAERALLEAGADARTIAALRAGRPVASQTEAAEAARRQAVAEQYRLEAWEADQARRAEAGRQTLNSRLAARRAEELKQGGARLRDKLVVYRHDRLEPYDNATLADKRLFLLYAAAGSDRASRKWTPQLVEFYEKFAPGHPDFELVLISGDLSTADQERQMKRERMPWPALSFEQLAQEPDLAALVRDGLPRLMLVDGSGKALADNFENGKLTDPKKVIDALVSLSNPR